MHGVEKRIVYILRSDRDPSRHYVGITNNLRDRLDWHNHGPSGHTTRQRPWSVVVSMEFPTEKAAVRFERCCEKPLDRHHEKDVVAQARDPEDSLLILRFLAQQVRNAEHRVLRRYDRNGVRAHLGNIYVTE